MRLLPALLAAAALSPAVSAAPPPIPAALACKPAAPCATPLPVKVVVVTMFEVGEDTGDKPGEFQLWRERRHLDTRIPFPQGYHDLFYNPESQILSVVTGVGTARAASATMALGLDPRLDLSQAYWLVAGIAGIDPADASIGSAAWAHYVVDGDLAHEIDAREIPAGWKSGYFPIDTHGPDDAKPLVPRGELYEVNPALREWAFQLTKDMKLPDDPGIRKARAAYTDFPNAQRPPFVLKGDEISAMTFWHGRLLNDWANDWVRRWTKANGEFVTSAMEESGTLQAIDYLDHVGKVDRRRVMVLRAGSNFTLPPPGISAADYLRQENDGYSGMNASLESLYLVGSKVVDELLGHWDRYGKAPPQ